MKLFPMSNDELATEIESTNRLFINKLSKLSAQSINAVPEDGGWSPGQVAEHIIKSNSGILAQLLNGEATSANRSSDQHIELIQNIFRSPEKMKTAAALEPGEPKHNSDDLIKKMEEHNVQQLETLRTKNLEELIPSLQFPPTPNGLTRYEWLIFMLEHTRRHANQIAGD